MFKLNTIQLLTKESLEYGDYYYYQVMVTDRDASDKALMEALDKVSNNDLAKMGIYERPQIEFIPRLKNGKVAFGIVFRVFVSIGD